ncbi:gem-associated protein 7-like [Halyomorpha halys]|uniref:gem-associated protein 7-like n=1 Tax=Halyomorpha halys TaxID=286706 RepID=UPI0006D4ED59
MSINCDVDNQKTEKCLEDEQQTRAVQREKFLRCISSIVGEYCNVKTVELNNVSGFYHGMDMHVQEIFMKNLSTPYSQLKNGLLRTQDLLYVSFPDIGNNSQSEKEKEEDVDPECKNHDSKL